jgi:hypothetical protein
MVVMEARVDSGKLNLHFQIFRIGERARRIGYSAGYDQSYKRCFKKIPQGVGNRACYASMCRRVFGVIGSRPERRPGGVPWAAYVKLAAVI